MSAEAVYVYFCLSLVQKLDVVLFGCKISRDAFI